MSEHVSFDLTFELLILSRSPVRVQQHASIPILSGARGIQTDHQFQLKKWALFSLE